MSNIYTFSEKDLQIAIVSVLIIDHDNDRR